MAAEGAPQCHQLTSTLKVYPEEASSCDSGGHRHLSRSPSTSPSSFLSSLHFRKSFLVSFKPLLFSKVYKLHPKLRPKSLKPVVQTLLTECLSPRGLVAASSACHDAPRPDPSCSSQSPQPPPTFWLLVPLNPLPLLRGSFHPGLMLFESEAGCFNTHGLPCCGSKSFPCAPVS